MSGAENIAVLGAISSIITIIAGTKKIYDIAKDKDGLPEAFREIRARLETVRQILDSAKQDIEQGKVTDTSCKGVKDVVAACEKKAEKLKTLFQKTCPADDACNLERYRKAVKAYGKGNRVENLTKGILVDVQRLACERGMRTATKTQQEQIARAIDDMSGITPSVSDDIFQEPTFTASNYGSGTQNNALGENVTQSGRQYISGGGTMNFGRQVFGTYAKVAYFSSSNEKDDYDACLASLFLTEPKDDREKLVNVKGSRVDGTCTWIRDNALYKTWTQSHSQCLWISGGPGKGKTMLSIFIAEELEKRIQPPSKELLLQFFCDNKDKNRNTATAIVSSLVYQLLRMRPQLFSHIENDFKARKWSTKSETARWPYETLWRIFEIMLSDPVLGAVYCILDGLDECDKGSLQVLLKKLRDIFSSKHPEPPFQHFNLIVVSRDAPDSIPELLSNMPRIRLDPDADSEVNDDIRRFIEVKVNKLSAVRGYPEELRVYVGKVFQDRAQGTFLWVGIVARALWEYGSTEVEKALDLFPPSLEEIYARILLQININRQEIAAKILRWVIMAVRPLSLSELSVAIDTPVEPSTVAFSHDEVMKEQVSYCGQFLSINQKDEVNLIHQSAKDYLLRKTPDPVPELEAFRVKEEIGNLEIARKCFDYLQNDALIDDEDRLYFAKQAEAKRFVVKERDLDGNTALHLASQCGHEAVLRLLLNHRRAYINIRNRNGRTALHLAISHEQEAVVRLLLDKGARTEAKDSDQTTALHIAAMRGHETVIRLLLDRGALIEVKNRWEHTALHLAAMCGHETAIRLLLDRKAHIDVKDDHEYTALHLAVRDRHETAIRLLLNREAHIEAKNKWKRTALHLAARNGHEIAIRLLLNKGAFIEAKDEDSETALHWAAEKGHETAVRLLLDRGAHIDHKDNKYGLTALHRAARVGHETTIRLLLDRGAQIEAKTNTTESTALHIAALNGHSAAIRVLLDKGAYIEAHKISGETALCLAAPKGHKTAIRLLLENGANVNAQNSSGETAADIARRVRQEVDIEEQPWYDSVIQLLTTSTIR